MGMPKPPPKGGTGGGGGFFLTQKGEKMSEVKKDIAELEALLAGATQTSQSTLLLKKRKEMREVDEALELMKDEYKRRMESCEERRSQFEFKQAKMREQVLKFEKFIQENDAKRQRAEAKAKQEKKLFEQKCQEMNSLGEKINELISSQKELELQLLKKGCYREYLEQFLEAGDGSYEEVADVLNRYKTLKDANADLMKHVDMLENDVDQSRGNLQSLKMETQNQLLVNNSLFQQHQKNLEEKRATTKSEEEEKNLDEDAAKNVARETSQVVQSIRNVFGRCQATVRNKSQYQVAAKDSSVSDLLTFNLDIIHARVSDLIEISAEYKAVAESSEYAPADLRDASGYSATTGAGLTTAGSQANKSGMPRSASKSMARSTSSH
eukprot:CAMPEP_0114430594 /NCGR_PEP_ID=MMETSP0103-20121206/10124_1 /TAXON_ID=37642 ORGANISM="Paraphysomonas imperforata, Strain PA2" /NCGR_SAMPLE_ID=MMETSP0103 /ASSEMBLY_ACC=CAM_ASM_000201 /LENGTH=380 /DNA_ID=CAMNT_0001600051 /DNA_START=157 /DNA_END=1299 /DNA_ORIENTATION=+